jgi:FtsP/CotA-like multicopper oxidase with cupredoxin domain
MRRREFLKYTTGGVAALVVGSNIPWFLKDQAHAATQLINFRITDAVKGMVTDNDINAAECYFWIYKEDHFPAECPGPNIFATQGDTIQVRITNALDEPHALFIPGLFNSGPIQPGQVLSRSFVASRAGTFLYYDNLNEPVNRVMGLHGAFIVMPAAPGATSPRPRPRPRRGGRPPVTPPPTTTQKRTPYSAPTPSVQKLFNDLGNSAHFPGFAWEKGDVATDTPDFRQYVWLLHQASPALFQEVGSLPAGQIYPAATFVSQFTSDPFISTGKLGVTTFNRKPQYFTINGQSGHFAHNNPFICPNNRVGEPVIIRVLNAGLWMHSMHIHANHVYVIAINGVVQTNPIWVDTFTANPLDTWDWLVPYMRPPDVPNVRGIGLPDAPLVSLAGLSVWPPGEELGLSIPQVGDPMEVQLSPLCYPMHDHSEPSQTSQGGNYNLGLISGINFVGDRTLSGPVATFPNRPTLHGPRATGPAAGPEV